MANNYLIVADDFTGANDTGVQMKRRGLNTCVIFSGKKVPDNAESLVIDTESRGMDAEDAATSVKNAVKDINFNIYKYVIKKVDSTLRGNIAAEIKALDEIFKSDLIIFAPALPDLSRITEDCVHKLNGVPITQTEIAKDPKKPVTEDNLRCILQRVYNEPVKYISLDEIRANKIDFNNLRIFVFDAVLNSDLQAIINAAKNSGKEKILWVGTAAMADNIMELESPTYPALGVVASVSEVTNIQIHKAEEAGVKLIKVPVHNILLEKENIAQYIDQTIKILNAGHDTIICSSSSYDRADMDLSSKAGAEKGMHLSDVSAYVQKLMGGAAKEILLKTKISGVFITGGDTAMGLMTSLEASGSFILSEIAVGIPMMKLAGGLIDGLKVVTKAGAFGKDDAVLFALRKLKEK